MIFEWDDANRKHVEIHGVDPTDCERALQDENAYTIAWPSYEPRWRTVGKSRSRQLLVFWTLRGENVRGRGYEGAEIQEREGGGGLAVRSP